MPGPFVPRRLGRYILGPVVGVGGMGTVHRAEVLGDGGFRRSFAVKLLHPHLAAAPIGDAIVAAFLREARLGALCHHPHVVPVLDAGRTPDGDVYIVSDFVDGVSLATLGRSALDDDDSTTRGVGLRILLDALAGLQAAHDLTGLDGSPIGLVHRDFTPGNILVDVYGYARLADFGLAKGASGPKLTETDAIKGTTAYLSPEQVRGEPLDRRSDVYAAGVVAWEVLAGRRLHDLRSPDAVLGRILFTDPTPLSDVWAACPPRVEAVVRRALHRAAPSRHATAAAFAEALEAAYVAEVGPLPRRAEVAAVVARVHTPASMAPIVGMTDADVASPIDMPKPPGSRRGVSRRLLAVAVGVAVVLGGLAGAGLGQREGPKDQAAEPAAASEATPDEALAEAPSEPTQAAPANVTAPSPDSPRPSAPTDRREPAKATRRPPRRPTKIPTAEQSPEGLADNPYGVR